MHISTNFQHYNLDFTKFEIWNLNFKSVSFSWDMKIIWNEWKDFCHRMTDVIHNQGWLNFQVEVLKDLEFSKLNRDFSGFGYVLLARSPTIHRPQWIKGGLSFWNLCLIDCLLVCGQILSFISSSSSVLLCYGILKNSLLWIQNNRS